jgi:pilus assembly protein Flp/PilA
MQSIMLALLTLKAQFEEQKERGATAVEYALVIGLISIALIVAATALTGVLDDIVEQIQEWFGAQEIG